MAAHFDRPQAQCQTCGDPGHSWKECRNKCRMCGSEHFRLPCHIAPDIYGGFNKEVKQQQALEKLLKQESRAVEKVDYLKEISTRIAPTLRRAGVEYGSVLTKPKGFGASEEKGAALKLFERVPGLDPEKGATWRTVFVDWQRLSDLMKMEMRQTLNAQAEGRTGVDRGGMMDRAMTSHGIRMADPMHYVQAAPADPPQEQQPQGGQRPQGGQEPEVQDRHMDNAE